MDSKFIGKKIKTLRNKQEMRQIELANRLSVANSTISNWENGRRLPSIAELNRIAAVFNVDLNYFEINQTSKKAKSQMRSSSDINQTIDTRPLGFNIPKVDRYCFYSGLIILLISHFIVFYFALFFLVIGLLLLGYTMFMYFMRYEKYRKVNVVKLSVPLESSVFYVNDLDQDTVKTYHDRLTRLILFLLISTIAFYVGLSIHLSSFVDSDYSILISLYALIAIVAAFHRFTTHSKHRLIMKRLDFYKVYKDLRYKIYFGCFLLDLIVFVSLITYLVVNQVKPEKDFLFHGLIALGFMNLVGSYVVLLLFKTFISHFKVTY